VSVFAQKVQMLTPEEQVRGPQQELPTPSRRTLSRMFQLLLLLQR